MFDERMMMMILLMLFFLNCHIDNVTINVNCFPVGLLLLILGTNILELWAIPVLFHQQRLQGVDFLLGWKVII